MLMRKNFTRLMIHWFVEQSRLHRICLPTLHCYTLYCSVRHCTLLYCIALHCYFDIGSKPCSNYWVSVASVANTNTTSSALTILGLLLVDIMHVKNPLWDRMHLYEMRATIKFFSSLDKKWFCVTRYGQLWGGCGKIFHKRHSFSCEQLITLNNHYQH